MKTIEIGAEETEFLRRQHVKHELMDYRHYCKRLEWLNEKIARIDSKLDGDVSAITFSAGITGGAVVAKDSWITSALAEQEELQKEKDVISYHVMQVEEWLSYLDDKFKGVLELYVITHNCTNLEGCTKLLNYPYKKALLLDVELAITKILEKNLKKVTQ